MGSQTPIRMRGQSPHPPPPTAPAVPRGCRGRSDPSIPRGRPQPGAPPPRLPAAGAPGLGAGLGPPHCALPGAAPPHCALPSGRAHPGRRRQGGRQGLAGVQGRGRDSLAVPLISSCSPSAHRGPAPALPSPPPPAPARQPPKSSLQGLGTGRIPGSKAYLKIFRAAKDKSFRSVGSHPGETLRRSPGFQHRSPPSSGIARGGGSLPRRVLLRRSRSLPAWLWGRCQPVAVCNGARFPHPVTQQRLWLTSQPRHLFSGSVIRNVSLIKASPI